MINNKICSFFGHSNITITDALRKQVASNIQQLINLGFNVFYFGGFSEFDEFCFEIVTKFKNILTNVNIIRIFCVWQEKYLTKKTPRFNCDNYDKIVYLTPTFEGWYKSIYFRNCAMIDKSDFILFYVNNKESSGAYKAYKYALSKKKSFINLTQINE